MSITTKPETKLDSPNTRNLALDVIRGVAVLGMIFINVIVFVPDFYELLRYDTLQGESTLAGLLYQWTYLLFNGKMRAMFALLFGAGILLFFQSKSEQAFNRSDYFARRMLLLLAFGLIHAYALLWPGSILFEYALCGLLLFSLRGFKTNVLFALSIGILGFYTYLNSSDFSNSYAVYKGYEEAVQLESRNETVPEELANKKEKFERYLENYLPYSESKAEEVAENKHENIALYTSGFGGIYEQNTSTSTEALSYGVYLNILESLGTMLLGMALFKLGFFTFQFKRNSYIICIAVGIPLGLYLYYLLYTWQAHTKAQLLEIYAWKSFDSFLVEAPARLILSMGYCALLVSLCRVHILKPALNLLGNVGRMAFSNYVGQTVICVLFFFAFKQYGSLTMTGLTFVSLSIIVFQIILSYFCIRYFNSGPIEFLWRSLAKRSLPE